MRNIVKTIKAWLAPKRRFSVVVTDVDLPAGTLYEELVLDGCECQKKPIKFFEGPSGGMCTNIFCGYCGRGYNVCPALGVAWRIHSDERYIETTEEKKHV
jgi:hypothetical protein